MRKIKKILVFFTIIIATILSIFSIIKYSVEAINVENTISGIAVQKTIIKAYSFTSSSYKEIALFPIDKYVFNLDSDFFCAQHGTPYGSSYRNTVLGDNYHKSYTITKHKVKTHYSSDPKGDIDTSANIYLDTNGAYQIKSADYYGHREKTESPADTVFTNWIYFSEDKKFDCESTYNSSEITDGGISFLLACYKQTDAERASTGYNNDPLQFAVWDWLGQGAATNPLKAAALSYQQYHEASKNPNVDTTPDENVGTTTNASMSTYKVGPFKMSAYVRAEDFSYDEVGTYQNVIQDSSLPGEDGQDIYDVNIDNKNVNLQSTIHEYDSEFDGTIIKAEAVVTNESGETKRISFPVPEPNEEYYIDLSAEKIEGFDEVLDIVFTYQRIHASGNGTKYIGKQEAVDFKQESTKQSSCSYSCQDGTGGCSTSKSPGTSSVPYNSTCTHTYYTGCWSTYDGSCDGCECSGGHSCDGCVSSGTDSEGNTTKTCPGNHTCSGCSCPGTHKVHHHGTYRTYTHTDPYECTHGHEDCWYFDWAEPTHGGDYAQDGFAASGALSTEKIEYKVRVSVPMKTKMAIYKYITKTEHVGESILTYNGDERKEMSMTEKNNDSLKVEKGDKITYTIDIVNDSRFPTMVKVKDTLPEPCSDEDIPDEIENSSWITVDPKSKKQYIITLRTNADTGKYTNTIEFITKNNTDPTMQYSEWDNNATHGKHTKGSIVNIYTKEKDSDTFEIKEYNVSLQKYIYDVSHNPENIEISNIDTTMNASNERKRGSMSEEDKASAPVYLEYGDIVTYRIVVYNTTDSVDEEFDVSDREAAPYWEPDKVYVSIQDTLPQKYKFISIEATGATGTGTTSYTYTMPNSESNSGGILKINDLMVPAGGFRILEIKLQVTEYVKGTIEENTAEFIGNIKNINRGPHRGSVTADKYCVVKNNSTNSISKDYYKLNDYNISLDKYLYKYDESKLTLNNSNGFTDETLATTEKDIILPANDRNEVTDYTREIETEDYKKKHPVNVEKGEKITYILKAINEAETSGSGSSEKHATQVRTTKIIDYMQKGIKLLNVSAKMYDSNGNVITRYAGKGTDDSGKITVGGATSTETVTIDGVLCNKYEFTIDNKTILNPGEYIEYTIEAEIVESNMYLYSLLNKSELTILTNINHADSEESTFIVKDDTHNENIASQQESSEYVRMKDLIISGKVWIDINKNGLMDDNARSDLEKINNNINADAMKKDVVVYLYQVDIEKPIRETKTDEDGLYTFGRDSELDFYDTFNHTVNYNENTLYQRVDKADNKDENGNYTDASQYLKYYVEFEYDGVLYKSTEIYAGMDNLTQNDGRYNKNYLIDSNAAELEIDREAFNKRYEYISYNVAYNLDKDKSENLVFQKDGHASYLMENTSRDMTSKSFVLKYNADEVLDACDLAMNSCGSAKWKQCSNHWDDWQVVIAMGLIDESKYPNTSKGREDAQEYLETIYDTLSNNTGDSGNTQLIKYLWLYSFNESVDNTIPETDYLKYINLGLELREDVDIELSKDVYKVKTTINGEEMEYDYNLGYTTEYLNDFIVKKPYGFEIYEADYKYRVDQYFANAVRMYKGVNGEDELNLEVTYRINLKNKSTTDDDELEGAPDTKLYTRVHEVLDLYDENFMELTFNDGIVTDTNNLITVKEKDENGFLVDKKISIGEAWMFIEENDVPAGLRKSTEKYVITNLSDVNAGTAKPNYKEDTSGTIVKAYLTISNISSRVNENDTYANKALKQYSTKANDFKADGYNTVYIRGMEDIVLQEGADLDIYVKYVVDKDKLITKIKNESFNKDVEKNVFVEDIDDEVISGKVTTIEILSTTEAEIERSLKLKDIRVDAGNPYKQQYGRGTENIAQINAYSVWYDIQGKVPASIVDKDSNAGNIGVQNISKGLSQKHSDYEDNENASADNIEFYEDNIYKTGIEIAAEGTENIKKEVNDRYGMIFGEVEDQILREIKGRVWDDSRSQILTAETDVANAKDKQYVGNGLYTDAEDGTNRDVKHEEAKHNESLPIFYKVDTNGDGKYDTEDNDLLVKDAKAEYIEIVKVPTEDGKIHYYEQVLMGVTWNQAQNERTNEKGEYHLKGMKPGNYIVRFTYGDTINDENYNVENIENISEEQKHMLIFNGQDYKSTVYNPHLEDTELDNDEILRRLEAEDLSDARDDEIRRLKTNSYSEVMTNNIAEILKGLANGTELTPNSDENTVQALKELTDNTYMNAETREFLVKAEKLTISQTALYNESKLPAANEINAIDNSKIVQLKEMLYKNLNYMKNAMVDNRDFIIENVDFGIEYRPESEISLIKEISEIKLIAEDKTTLVDLHFKSESDGKYRKHSIDPEKSKGLELVQFITNDYTTKALINNLMSEESLQGLVYIQLDQELFQGCTVQITYSFEAQNNSEVDRISTNLDEIRYRANPKATTLITEFKNKGFEIVPKVVNEKGEMEEKYTASGTAANIIDAETYRDEKQVIGNDTVGKEEVIIRYRTKEKLMTTIDKNGDDEYFGKYNGYSYYTGRIEKGADGNYLDTIASLKFDKILDYVDTGLKYEPNTTQLDITDKLWNRVTTDELINHVYQLIPYRPGREGTSIPALTNVESIKYESLVVSVDDRTKDDKYSSDRTEFSSVDNSTIRNNDLSRFLLPKVLETGYLPDNVEEYDNYINKVNTLTEEQKRTFSGKISLEVSKVLAADTEEDDMTYENMAEIIQFTTLTGRRTNFATTIGNADMHRTKAENPNANPGSTEFMTASLEADTSATETVTLIPPTGLMKNRRAIVNLMETAKTSVEVVSIAGLVVAIIAVIVLIILFVIRKYKKRRIV